MSGLSRCPLLIALIVSSTGAAAADSYPAIGTIERLDPKLDVYIPKDAKIEKLADGFEWAEGPVWVRDGGYLLFSDVPHNVVHRWSADKGLTEFLKPSGYTGKDPPPGPKEPGSNGLTIGPDGQLVLCQHGDRRVAKLNKTGAFETLADRFEGKRFNSPNDLCFDKAGNLYFTDPPYGLPDTFKSALRELPFTGVYRVSKEGKLSLVSKDMTAPNGVALSPDEKTLYVANSDREKPVYVAFELNDDGTAKSSRVLFDATEGVKAKKKGSPDGLKVAADGTLFATGPGGVIVITADGKHLGTIAPGADFPTANCAFGDADGKTLYLTSDMNLCRVKLNVKGNGF
jgi:gluconolactonase